MTVLIVGVMPTYMERDAVAHYGDVVPSVRVVTMTMEAPAEKNIEINLTLFQRQRCRTNEKMTGRLCYPKCKDGYHRSGCCTCVANGGQV